MGKGTATASTPRSLSSLKIATALTSPVLIRLSTPTATIVLLAEDSSHHHAADLRLHTVRWVRGTRGIKSLLSFRHEPFFWSQPEARLHLYPQQILLALPHHSALRIQNSPHTFTTTHLSQAQYESLQHASPKRLLQAAQPRKTPTRSLTRAALTTFHRLRFLLRRQLAPVLAR